MVGHEKTLGNCSKFALIQMKFHLVGCCKRQLSKVQPAKMDANYSY